MDKEIFYNKKMSPFISCIFNLPRIDITILIIATFYFLGKNYFDGDISISVLVGISSTFVMIKSSIDHFISVFKVFTKNFVNVEKLWDFFDNTPKIEQYDKGENFEYKKGNIEIKNLTYGYDTNNLVLKDFNLKIKGGNVVALVGNSGGGKSTLAKLIAGYIKYQGGEILIDNQKLHKLSLKSYYKNIGYLIQEPSVFDGTVMDNLTYSLEIEVEKSKIEKVITDAKCEFIYDLPNGFDTEIGERGVKLSGGQKQRLAIAKIMLKNPKIVILDEPTSALDSFSEAKITEAMNNLFRDRTVIVIAHRLQTVKHADMIYFLESGKIIESVTHKELLQKKGRYYDMIELQSGF